MDDARLLAGVLTTGIGATVVMDLYAALRRRWCGEPGLDYALVGRWLGHLRAGKLRHQAIARSEPIRGEACLGWVAHYLTGIGFAALLVGITGRAWLQAPTPGPALIFGLASVAAPFLILQPALGAGIAASRTPAPGLARRRSLLTHLVFGLGLYLSALGYAQLVGINSIR